MPRFRFNLQPVLDQRLRVEREKQRRVAELERERLAIEREIAGHERAITAERDDLRARLFDEKSGAPVNLPQIRQQAHASLGMIARAQRAVVKLAGVQQRLDAARLELLKAAAARRGVEVLRDRRYEAWRDAQARAESGALDEMSVMRAGSAREEEP
jgi:flagellar export protein FliJ